MLIFQSVVRTSDVRVSNRVNKNSVTLDRYPTIYNDLIGEVSYTFCIIISILVDHLLWRKKT